MPNTKILKENGQEFYPVTHASLIVGMENQGRMDATYAWDGTGTPDITKIPAGVVVIYEGTNYTGTLAASADTAGRFYLVPSTTVTGEYDRYLTDATGSTITWKPAGTTAIPTPSILDNVTSTDTDKALSANQGKLLKDEVSQLQHEATDLRTDVGEKNSTTVRHTIATDSNFTNSGKGVIADSTNPSFGNTTGSTSFSATAYVDVESYAGKILKYTRQVVSSTNQTTRSFGLVFYTAQSVSAAISGEVFKYSEEPGVELTDIEIPSSAKYARFTLGTVQLENFQAYVEEIVQGDYINGLGKRVKDLEDSVEEDFQTLEENIEGIDDRLDDAEGGISSLGEQMEEVYEGKEVRTFVKSVVSQLGYGTLSIPIVLSTVGDYVEFKVKLTDGRGGSSYNYFLMLNPGEANQPNISIYSRSQFSIRLPGKSGNNYTDSTLFANGNEVKAKIILDSIENGTYSYKVFINDVEREYTDLTSTSAFTLDSIGRTGLTDQSVSSNGADWFYLKYRTAGVDYSVDEFATELTSPSGITDIYSSKTIYGLNGLNEKVAALEGNSALDGVLRYTAESEQFEFLSRYGASDKYFSFVVKHTANNNVLRDLWRVMGGNLYTYGGDFSLEHSTIYGSSENEWAAFFNEFRGQNNYTGGYHGGEMITDTGCFVKFFADGVELTDLSADFEIPCKKFEYIQYSALHEVYGTDGETPVPDHPIFAYHTKHTSFQDAEMECRNDVAFVLPCTRRSYHAGLFSPERNAGTSAVLPFGIVAALSGTGNFTMASYGMNVSEIKFWNPTNKCGVNIQSEFIAGINEDEMSILGTSAGKAEFGVLDNGSGRTDAKYYKRTNKSVAIASGDVISTRHSVKFMAQ